ncbi:hypothetical protein MDG893_13134 [Marinobacter algicola DG893]|uniref:Peptidoglycan binding-like domain-containing protein n=2 Tax=Marinobacter algicola TaxID=236100 RepID=A6F4B5_9GAMM|nr:hypothetical protein MDG893_13134 [Marinobacter algicola DG893]
MKVIMRVQLGLMLGGFYDGEIDGMMGPKTRMAIQDYRDEKNLSAGNLIDSELLNSLGIAAQ